MVWISRIINYILAYIQVASIIASESGGSDAVKGHAFEKVKGPRSLHDRIAIVGAGAAGVHMAYKLKKAGFSDVTIYEMSSRIGGKSQTVQERGTVHEMGTVYCQPDYTEIYRLVEEFQAGELLPMPSPLMWMSHSNWITLPEYLIQTIMEMKKMTIITEAMSYVGQVVKRYSERHFELFGEYEGELMPRPSLKCLTELNVTFLEYLKRNDLEVLKPIIYAAHTDQGYGQMDNISALYGLMWMTPAFLQSITTPVPPMEKSNVVKILEKGFQNLWEQIANKSDLNVQFDYSVDRIERNIEPSYIDIYFKRPSMSDSQIFKERFDFLILTPTMKGMIDIVDFSEYEKSLFNRTTHTYYTTTLVDTEYSSNRGPTPQNHYIYNVISGTTPSVWVDRDSFAALNYLIGDNYTEGLYEGGTDGKFIETSVYYQMTDNEPNKQLLTLNLQNHLKLQKNVSISKERLLTIWPYFPRYSPSDLSSGVLWDIFEYQGERNTWYIGSSVSFESVKSVVEYNNLIMRNYEIPSHIKTSSALSCLLSFTLIISILAILSYVYLAKNRKSHLS